MIRFLFRFIGLLCLALGFILLVYDGTKSIADQRLVHHQGQRRVDDGARDQPGAGCSRCWSGSRRCSGIRWRVPFSSAPSWLVLVILGALLMIVGRKKKPLIGYARN